MPLTPEEIANRLIIAEECLARCHTKSHAEKKFCEQTGLTRRRARRYFAAVRKLWMRQGVGGFDERRAEIRARIMSIYARASDEGDLKTALRALERIAVLDGVGGETVDHRVLVAHKMVEEDPAPILPAHVRLKLLDVYAEEGIIDGEEVGRVDED